jgi:HSP20 family molecular chaperone IbpA
MVPTLPIKRTQSIVDGLERMRERIVTRAYEIFEGRGAECGHDLDDWLSAERELVWEPPVELEESDDELTVKLSAPGIDPKDIEVELTPEDLLVEAETHA